MQAELPISTTPAIVEHQTVLLFCLLSVPVQAVLGVLETAVGRSRDMFSAGAYVHQYAQFGAERGDFEEAFLGVEQAVENYRSLG